MGWRGTCADPSATRAAKVCRAPIVCTASDFTRTRMRKLSPALGGGARPIFRLGSVARTPLTSQPATRVGPAPVATRSAKDRSKATLPSWPPPDFTTTLTRNASARGCGSPGAETLSTAAPAIWTADSPASAACSAWMPPASAAARAAAATASLSRGIVTRSAARAACPTAHVSDRSEAGPADAPPSAPGTSSGSCCRAPGRWIGAGLRKKGRMGTSPP